MDFFEDLNNGSDKVYDQILQNYEKSKKIKVEGYKDKNGIEKKKETKELLESEMKKLDLEENKKEKESIVDEDGFILVQKKGKK